MATKLILRLDEGVIKVIALSLASDFKDFEDVVQCYSAVTAKVDCRIPRNKSDFLTDILPILTPEEFLAAGASESAKWYKQLSS